MIPTPRVAVIVVAAGSGSRLGGAAPKAFVELAGRPILEHALDGVFGMSQPAQVIVVAPDERVADAAALSNRVAGAASGYVSVTAGGATRQLSVAAGLAQLDPGIDVVLVHDAARALTPSAQLDAVAAAVVASGAGVIPGLPVTDTIKRVDAGEAITETVDRSQLRAVQTPQGFPRAELTAAYAAATVDYTDDAALFSTFGGVVAVVPGSERAFKITTPWDLRRAEQLLGETPGLRTGVGVDVHAYDTADPLWLAGLHWPDEPGLSGHSDGDAVSHAITDALLSAAALGDIGGLFGVDDERFAGAHGDVFLSETRRRVEAAGFRIVNVAVQVLGNRPRFVPRRAEAQALLSGILGAPVSLAATTTDHLGFTGRGEGVTAVATALLSASSAAHDH